MTTKKREYLAANIRAGYTASEAAEVVKHINSSFWYVRVISLNHGRDVNGNGTAHYNCLLVEGSPNSEEGQHVHVSIVQSGKRREQVGYSGQNEAALYALSKLGFEVDTSRAGNYDYHDSAVYPLINFPPVVQS
jgi:hypothetical protein